MKKFLVVLLACAMIFGFATTALAADTQIKEFSDIADQSQAAQNAIMKLAVLGVVEGNEGVGGSFRPADNLTRAEFAKIVCYLTDNVKVAESLASVGTKFTDVSVGNWYTGWVNAAAQSGYFLGDPGGTFRPNANITMQEVVTVALRAAGYTDKLGNATGNTTWPGNYITKAMSVGLLDDVTFVGSSPATRADMALICNETLGINMVVHISNEIAYAMSLAAGEVDPDGFSEVYYLTNETDKYNEFETILHKAFDGVYYDVQVAPAYASAYPTEGDLGLEVDFDESYGWYYEDFATGELAVSVIEDVYKGNKKFEEVSVRDFPNAEALAETYYVTRGFDLPELAGMQVQLTVIDSKEIAFVDVVSSYLYADAIHQDRAAGGSAQNITVDGKSYRPSNTLGVKSISTVEDYSRYYFTWNEDNDGTYVDEDGTTHTEWSRLLNLATSNNDDDFPGKVYLDKNGRIYGVKNYNVYNETPFGIFDDIDSDRVNWKDYYRGDSDNLKIETAKNYTMYKDGEFIKAEDLEENDLVSRLNSNGAPFFYASSPLEGELTQQTATKLTLAGTGYRVVSGFKYSDDGGETFTKFDMGTAGNEVDFGEAEYAKAYNFSRLAYVSGNLTNQKLIGVITKIEPTQNWSNSERQERYQEITIFNAEGKEVTYSFTNDFRDGYTWFASASFSGNWIVETKGQTKWETATAKMAENSVEQFATRGNAAAPLAKGDIIQLVLDKNDKVKRIDNYAKFTTAGTITAKITSSNSRIMLPSTGGGTTTPGTYTLNKDAVVFNVSPDGSKYDDVDLMSVASVLTKDFDAAKVVAFDVKTGANVNALYIIGDVSVYQFGIVTGQGRDNTGDYYTVNGKRVYSDNRTATVPSVVSYKVSGGEATLTALVGYSSPYLALRAAGGSYVTNVQSLLDYNNVTDSSAVVGTAKSYVTSTKALEVISGSSKTYVYITSDTYLYDLDKDDDVDSAADLLDKTVMAFYDKDNNAVFVAILRGTGSAANVPTAGDELMASALEAIDEAFLNEVNDAIEIEFAAGATPTTTDISNAIVAALAAAGITDGVTVEVVGASPDFVATVTVVDVEPVDINVTAVFESAAAPVLDGVAISADGETITISFKQNIATTLGAAALKAQVDLFTGTNSNVVTNSSTNISTVAVANGNELVITLSGGSGVTAGEYFKVLIAAGAVTDATGAEANASITTTPRKYTVQLTKVTTVSLSAVGIAGWTAESDDANVTTYSVQLYKDGAVQGSPQTVAQGGADQYDFLSAMRAAGVGSYTITVTAIGDGNAYLDADESEASSTPRVIAKLATPTNPTWDTDDAKWDKLADETAVASYLITINGDGTVAAGGVVATTGSNLTVAVTAPAATDTFTVKAVALTTGLFLDSDEVTSAAHTL